MNQGFTIDAPSWSDPNPFCSKLKNISEAQALFFFTKSIVLVRPTLETMMRSDTLKSDSHTVSSFNEAVSASIELLSMKGNKLGRDFENSDEVFLAAKFLISCSASQRNFGASAVDTFLVAAATFARWAFRLGHPKAQELLSEISPRNLDATYFLARILQKGNIVDMNRIEKMYKRVECGDKKQTWKGRSASKAKQRLLMLKWPKPLAALRIYLWYLKRRRQRHTNQFRVKSLRDLSAIVCEAELKFPYSFCK
jgi:hypothetical protein